MLASGIICEYNPFHAGHARHIAQTARMTDGAPVVCVMSGNFVQRGDVAVLEKHARAEAAVRCGASLVLELPLPWACSGAERFAMGGVGLLSALGVAGWLSFGSECGDVERLRAAADCLDDGAFRELLRGGLSRGLPFAAARQAAVGGLDEGLAALYAGPNNILGIEYLKALRALGSPLRPLTVRRAGPAHDAFAPVMGAGPAPGTPGEPVPAASASALRAMLSRGETAEAMAHMPEEAARLLYSALGRGRAPVLLENLDTAVMAQLRRLAPSDYAALPDVSEGLENRLYRAARDAVCLDDACARAKSKRYAYARLRRIYLSAFLGLRQGMTDGPPPYARVLAFDDRGRALLREISRRIPVVTKPAAARELDERGRALFALEARADDLYALAYPGIPQRAGGQGFRTSPVYVRGKGMPDMPGC